MFLVKKILTPFMLPPGIFIWILIGSGVWVYGKKSRKAGLIQIVIGLLMWMAALGPVSNGLYRGLEAEFHQPADIQGDVLILLGGGINSQAADLTGTGIPSPELLQRIVGAVRLHKRLKLPIIATGSSPTGSRVSEASVVKRYLMELGVSEEFIVLEEKALDTYENAKFSQAICRRFGYQQPILITSAFHMKRAKFIFEKVGLAVRPFPVAFRWREQSDAGWRKILPTDYRDIYLAAKEYIGLLMYRFMY